MSLNSEVMPGVLSAREAALPAYTTELDDAQSARFFRIVSASLSISRHYQLYRWLSGELQQFLPHQILIAAWGDFEKWDYELDIVSALPGVRTAELARCSIDPVVREAYERWIAGGRRPLTSRPREGAEPRCCHLHGAIHAMRSTLVHGVRDQRGGEESLYIALHAGSITRGRPSERFNALVDSLIAHIDFACRRVAALRVESYSQTGCDTRQPTLSGREREILELICRGQRNDDIAQALCISPYTVKNHVQRIFRKIGVRNRTQAAARWHGERGSEQAGGS